MYIIKLDFTTQDDSLMKHITDLVKNIIDRKELLHFSIQIHGEG